MSLEDTAFIEEFTDLKPIEQVDGKTIPPNANRRESIDEHDDEPSHHTNLVASVSSPAQDPVTVDDRNYNMNHAHRGTCLIFNHSTFDRITQLSERRGTDTDRDNMKMLFSFHGFNVKTFNNLTVSEVKGVLDKYAQEVDHTDCDAFAVFFLSHGEEGHLYARNNMFKAEDLFSPFHSRNCSSLAGKPKMFFIQACRGGNMDSGLTVYERFSLIEQDFTGYYKIPFERDFLICWATVPGFFSWRNPSQGSWFIKAILIIFCAMAKKVDVLTMMTAVNNHVAHSLESYKPNNPECHGMKQTSHIISTLTRKIFLPGDESSFAFE